MLNAFAKLLAAASGIAVVCLLVVGSFGPGHCPINPPIAGKADPAGYRDRVKRPYIHLVDGGLIDNLGVRAPIDFAIESGGFQELADALGYRDIAAAVFVSVNAETDPALSADKSADIPTLFQLLKALELPVNALSFDTLAQLHASIERWREQVRKRRVAAGLGSEGPRFYFIDVSLRAIPDGQERDEFMRIPTALRLDDATVDRLRALARKLFFESPDLARLRRDFAG